MSPTSRAMWLRPMARAFAAWDMGRSLNGCQRIGRLGTSRVHCRYRQSSLRRTCLPGAVRWIGLNPGGSTTAKLKGYHRFRSSVRAHLVKIAFPTEAAQILDSLTLFIGAHEAP